MRKKFMGLTASAITLPTLGLVAFGGAIATPASAGASSPSGGKISLWSAANLTGATSKIVVVGAIADSGIATSIDKNGKVDPNGAYVRIVLKKGSFEADASALVQNSNAAGPTLDNAATCSFAFVGSGPLTLSNGRGAYTGIAGTVNVTQQFVGIGPRYKTGKNKGACNQSDNARPVVGAGAVSGTGTVTFTG